MRTLLNPPDAPAHDSFVEKKSEFIGDAAHVEDFDEALAFIASVRERHPKARHVAWAVVCSDEFGNARERMSDDGEPSGTAGKPILEALRMNGLTNTVVTVTRYFGGILLGSGGLTRAYSTGAVMAVRAGEQAELVECRVGTVTLTYAQLEPFRQLLTAVQGVQGPTEYTDAVELGFNVPVANVDALSAAVTERFNASVSPVFQGVVMRAVPQSC
ncbi:IMPACT family protein [Bifidobacterium gallicum]|uniref:IMPACT family member n=1 Tax=Bifidobacterium gallicum DSM 20093 = LMG 11596 TaxID=561180 RepID=D1NVF0_9BIFI|nr:YigZ family protein [Bifidobacterium gallicum]EFA22801.1 putative YigZ family protein [Bifidobacterium gallicum DSM 20093 = LMG 11596]KFI59739.1 IMPACT family member [Bifidobacterium gallicum DSM 20093 = LMG 11596]